MLKIIVINLSIQIQDISHLIHIQSLGVLAEGVQGLQLRHKLGRVVAAVLGDNAGQLAQRGGERLHSVRLFAWCFGGLLGDGLGHHHLGTAAAIHGPTKFDC